jgi:hypothetical protein
MRAPPCKVRHRAQRLQLPGLPKLPFMLACKIIADRRNQSQTLLKVWKHYDTPLPDDFDHRLLTPRDNSSASGTLNSDCTRESLRRLDAVTDQCEGRREVINTIYARDTQTPPRHQRDTTETLHRDTPPRRRRDITEIPRKHNRDKTAPRQDSIETAPRHYRDTTEAQSRHHRDSTETHSRHHRDTTETPPRHHRDSAEIAQRQFRDIAETVPRQHRGTIETPPRHHRDTTETPPRHHRDSTPVLQHDAWQLLVQGS